MTNATDSITDSTNAAIAFSLIDADVHNYPNTIADLTPYLPTRWQEYATQSGLQLPGVSLYPKVFAHAARRDAWPPSGDKPGSNPAFAAEQLLDAWSIERAILNPLVAASALHNYELANVMARAGNEWTAAQWLDADPRWRASIAVNIRDPEAAAAEIRHWAKDPRFVQVLLLVRSHALYGKREFRPIFRAAAAFRIYYDESKDHMRGRITEPIPGSSFTDSLHIALEGDDASIIQVDFIGLYEDFDYEGNGLYRQWHYHYRHGKITQHIGSASNPPYALTWHTSWIPEQEQPVEIAARVLSTDGIYYMTETVANLTLAQRQHPVVLYKPYDVPARWQTRLNSPRHSNRIFISHHLDNAVEAQMLMATWSRGHAEQIGINSTRVVDRVGRIHDYSYDEIDVPLELLKPGDNELFTISHTEHHGIEVLWPGIVLKVRYAGDIRLVSPPSTQVSTPQQMPRSVGLQLLPSYPNPFNGYTTLRFSMFEQQPVDLGVYNLLGQRLATPASGLFASGSHHIRWDGRNHNGRLLASGVYLYRLRAGGHTAVNRLLILR